MRAGRRAAARLSLDSADATRRQFPGYRLTRLVAARPELDEKADYRAMPDVRQMMAASIVWLYRAGKDNVWLRRVPCTWHAADAIACMRANGAFEDWARLYALYPGW